MESEILKWCFHCIVIVICISPATCGIHEVVVMAMADIIILSSKLDISFILLKLQVIIEVYS